MLTPEALQDAGAGPAFLECGFHLPMHAPILVSPSLVQGFETEACCMAEVYC